MKHILFISHSILDFNLMTLVCETLPLKTKLTHLNPDNPVISKKKFVDLIIMDLDALKNSERNTADVFLKLAAKFDGPCINFSEDAVNYGKQGFYQKPFEEECIRELILKFLKIKI